MKIHLSLWLMVSIFGLSLLSLMNDVVTASVEENSNHTSPPSEQPQEDETFGKSLSQLVSKVEQNVVKGVEVIGKALIAKHIESHNFHPLSKLAEIVPEVRGLLADPDRARQRLKECYNSAVGEKQIDIFKDGLSDIVYTFVNSYRDYLSKAHLANIKSRVLVLIKNLKIIARSVVKCALRPDGQKPTKLGLTPLAIYTQDEFIAMLISNFDQSGRHPSSSLTNVNEPQAFTECDISGMDALPPQLDWREKDIVSRVKYQGECGSCFIFSSISTIESAYMMKMQQARKGQTNTNNQTLNLKLDPQQQQQPQPVVEFSEQAMLNCVGDQEVCETGGFPDEVFDRAITEGVTLRHLGPRYDEIKHSCEKYPEFSRISSYCYTEAVPDVEGLMKVVAKHGPAVIGVSITPEWQWVKGPFQSESCDAEANHAVTLVGWDQDNLIIKNSWGKDWGVDGYLVIDKQRAVDCQVLGFVGVPFFDDSANDGNNSSEPTNQMIQSQVQGYGY